MGYNTRVKSISEKIVSHTKSLDATCEIYNQAMTYILDVMYREFSKDFKENINTVTQIIEKFINSTKKNPLPKYGDFNIKFPKFPSYFRRAAIASAYGHWSSWRSNYKNWEMEKANAEAENSRFTKKAPTMQLVHNEYPVFYKGNMFVQTYDGYRIKVYRNNDWVWEDITVKKRTNLVKRGITGWKQCNPKMVKRGSKYFLTFAYEKDISLHKKSDDEVKILAVDLGITNTAVCSVMDSSGTVLGRLFIKQSKEKDHFYHLTNKLKKAQRKTAHASCPRYWNRIKGLRQHMINDTCHQILEFAKKHGADTIVFEKLGKIKTPKGFYGARRLRFKLHWWDKTAIQNKTEIMAHYNGMRISRVLAAGTSKLAFDGSGKVERSARKDLCTFSNGKKYHADLSASYNIGARFYIRSIIKPLPEKVKLVLGAKVPEVLTRTQQTLDTLLKIKAV